ncbi:MAG TPA: hypothetical protein VLJ59_09185 [Mycobacteriales bacterium]|nr:hypothetical protein [Mycobacteriales bacterium]
MSGDGLDRVRRRVNGVRSLSTVDAEGKRALFSPTDARPAAGSVTLDCSSCGQRSTLTILQAARGMLPSLYLPLVRRYASWVRCPACRRRTWCRIRLRF